MNKEPFDVVIVGGGTGGYVAAIRAAQLGLTVAVIEEDRLGGTCLHRGCIPTKSLLRSAELAHTATHLHQFGIEVPPPVLHWHKMKDRTRSIVQTLYQGVQGLIRKNRVQLVEGRGTLAAIEEDAAGRTFRLTVTGQQDVLARQVILATGSRPATLGLAPDPDQIMTSNQALERRNIPKSVIIAGGGTIGMEWASLYNDLGADVTVVESLDRIMAAEDEDIAQEAHRLFVKRGVRIYTGASIRADGILTAASGVRVPIAMSDSQPNMLDAEALLIAVGRRPNVENLHSEAISIELQGPFVKVDSYQRTSVDGVYAIGDVCGGALAHVAARQGVIAVEKIAGAEAVPFDPRMVPKCTYIRPEIASIGLTEQGAKKEGYDVVTGRFPFQAIGKALVYGEYEGFVKIVTDSRTGAILGVHAIGPHATDLISEPGVVMANELTYSEWLRGVHAHPTLSEIYHEALLAVDRKAIHS